MAREALEPADAAEVVGAGHDRKGRRQPTTRIVTATFCPARVEDLRPEGWARFGWRGTWQALWVVKDPNGPYDGQTMWWPVGGDPWFGWVPDEDLIDVVPEDQSGQ